MRKFHAMLILVVLLSALFIPALAAEVERQSATLFPGQTVTVLGIKITWNFKENRGATGTFDIVGPNNSIKDLPAGKVTVYIDGVVIIVTINEGEDASIRSKFYITAEKHPQKYDMGGRPFDLTCYVSNICPISINEFNFRVSDEKKVFPNGTSFYMLEIEDSKSGEKTSIPLNVGAQGLASRASVQVGTVYEDTKTALFRVYAKPDYSVRGKNAYIEKFEVGNYLHHPIKDFLDDFGKQYGFEVKWIPYPGHPESVELAQNFGLNLSYNGLNNITVEKIIGDLARDNYLTLDWETPTILAVSYKNFDKYLEYQKSESEKKEKDQKISEEFKKDYALETKAYAIKNVSVQTAKSLIAPELDTYFLAKVGRDSNLEIIPGHKNSDPPAKVDKVMESAEADEKTGTLFLTATKKTHEKFQSMMAKIDAWVSHTTQPTEAEPYKVIVTLLEGSKVKGGVMPGVPTAPDLPWIDAAKAVEQYGISKDDLKVAGIDFVRPISTGIIYLVPEKNWAGQTMLSLTSDFTCRLEYIDRREPYLIVRVALEGIEKDKNSKRDVTYFENTLYLVPGKSTLVGITNLNGAQIVILKLEPAEKEQGK